MPDQSDPIRSVGIELLKMLGSFIFGLLMRKKVGRFFVKAKKWLLNDFIRINLISIRIYPLVENERLDMEVFHEMQKRIPNLKLDSVSHNAMQIGMPTFGTMNIIISSEPSLEEEAPEETKISVLIKDPIRLGIREMDLVHEYYHNTELVFQVVEGTFSERPKINRNYIIAEISRVGGFLEEKSFEIDDEDFSAHIHATSNTITITAEPPTYITKTVKKYLLA